MAGKNLVSLVHEAIDKLALIGLCVKCVICDQGSNNRNFMQTLCGVSVGQPYFTHNGHKVYALYDPPHLLKNIRNKVFTAVHGRAYLHVPPHLSIA